MPTAAVPTHGGVATTPAARITTAVAALVGLAIAVAGRPGGAVVVALHLAGYPVACAVIARFVSVVRGRHRAWFVAHQGAMVAICAGWALTGRWSIVAANALWLAAGGAWWWQAGRRR